MDAQTRPLNICIVSRRNIYRNTRVVRQAGALSDAGHNVTVVCFVKPHEELLASVPRVRFIEVPQAEVNALTLRRIRPHLQMDVLAAVPPMRHSFDVLDGYLLWRIKRAEKRGIPMSRRTGTLSARMGALRGWERYKRKLKASVYDGVQRFPGGSMAWEGYRWAKRVAASRVNRTKVPSRQPRERLGVGDLLRASAGGPRTPHAHLLKTQLLRRVHFGTANAPPVATASHPLIGLNASLDRLALKVLASKQRKEIDASRMRLSNAGAQHRHARLDTVIESLAALDPVTYDIVRALIEDNIVIDVGFSVLALEKLGDIQFDYVQSHDCTSLLSAEVIRRQKGGELVYDAVEIPEHRAVAEEHIDVDRATKDDVYRRIEAAIFLKSGKLLTIGEKLSQWYAETYEIEPPRVLRNCRYYSPPVDDQRLRHDCDIGPDVPLLLWFGGGYPKQGMSFAIRTLAKMREDVHLAMLTEFMSQWAWYEEELHALVEAGKLQSRVHFLPLRPPNDLLAYASSASVGLIPRPKSDVLNVEYSLPNKLFEMIMSRTPIAATDLPNVQQIIRQYDIGCTLIDGDPEASAEALQALLDEVAQGKLAPRLEAAARDLCWEKEAQRLVAFYAVLSGCAGAMPAYGAPQ